MKKTVVIGASPDKSRYSNLATSRLAAHGHEVIPLGIRRGSIDGLDIVTTRPSLTDVDTITLYLNPERQKDWYDYILNLKPARIIFNPGTENSELETLALSKGILVNRACTLVLLSTHQY